MKTHLNTRTSRGHVWHDTERDTWSYGRGYSTREALIVRDRIAGGFNLYVTEGQKRGFTLSGNYKTLEEAHHKAENYICEVFQCTCCSRTFPMGLASLCAYGYPYCEDCEVPQ